MKNQINILAIGIGFWLLYFLSIFNFEALWGLNFIRFLPKITQVVLLSISLLSIVLFPFFLKKFKNFKLSFDKAIIPSLLVAFVLFYSQNIAENVYGDSVLFIQKLGDSTSVFSSKYLINLFSLDISNPKLGNLTVLSFIRLLSLGFDISHQLAFQILGIVSGLFFVSLSFTYIKENIKTISLQWLLLFVVILSPSNQLFLGHYEIYAPTFPATVWYLLLLKRAVNKTQRKQIILLTIALLICIKLHFTFILLTPSFLFTLGLYFNKERFQKFINWSFFSKFIIAPFIALGTIAYFFVFKDYNDERFLNPSVDIFNRLFLPIVSPEAPLDRYNLLSFNHIFDFLNMGFLWSAAGILLVIVIALFYRKKIRWNQTEIVLVGSTFLFYALVLFAFNPLMAMPIDFDLFSIVAPIFLFFVFFCVEQIESNKFVKLVGGSILGISLFSLAIFNCNHMPNSLSQRMESVGKHVFKSYWIRSAGDIESGLNLVKSDTNQYIHRYLAVADELEEFAVKGKDSEYAHILWSIGKFYRTNKDYEKALSYHLQSEEYSTKLKANYIGLMESNFYLRRYTEAYGYSLKLIAYNYPNEKRALEIAIDCSLRAGMTEETLMHIDDYLQKWDNSNFRQISYQLRN